MGKRDELRGLKENVIVGRLIPAGTGLAYHQAHKAVKWKNVLKKNRLHASKLKPRIRSTTMKQALQIRLLL